MIIIHRISMKSKEIGSISHIYFLLKVQDKNSKCHPVKYILQEMGLERCQEKVVQMHSFLMVYHDPRIKLRVLFRWFVRKKAKMQCFKAVEDYTFHLICGIKSSHHLFLYKCLYRKGRKYTKLSRHNKFAIMCILRTCVCSNKNDYPRMKRMMENLRGFRIELQFVEESMSHKML